MPSTNFRLEEVGRVSASQARKNQEIFTFFMKGIPDSRRDKGRVVNRIKVVVGMFKLCDELAKRSGGGWDDATNRPIAPSEQEYEEMVRAKGEKAGFLLRGNFPWYRKMESMQGGQTAKGLRTSEFWDGSEPIHCLLDSQMSIHVSSQGSSDEPDEDSVRSTDRQPGSHSSVPASGSSGSKRKSTPESSEPNIRGKKYKERNQKKQSEVIVLADVGLQMVAQMRQDTKALTAPSDEETLTLTKLGQLQFPEEENDFCFKFLEKSSYKRKWFMMTEREEILRFVRKEMRGNPTENVPRPSPPANTGPNQGFPQSNPTASANAAYTQFYPPQNSAASNFFFNPNEKTW